MVMPRFTANYNSYCFRVEEQRQWNIRSQSGLHSWKPCIFCFVNDIDGDGDGDLPLQTPIPHLFPYLRTMEMERLQRK